MRKCKLTKEKSSKGYSYLKCELDLGNGKSFIFSVKPLFLNKKQYGYLMRVLDNEEK